MIKFNFDELYKLYAKLNESMNGLNAEDMGVKQNESLEII